MSKYVIGIDQSTQGTKALLFDETGRLIMRTDKSHRQLINDRGWVEHDPEEIYKNTIEVVRQLLEQSAIDRNCIATIGISNQRETAVVWNRKTGKPVYHAIVWQCARGKAICERLRERGIEKKIKEYTGLPLSPYFTAAKFAWILENIEEARTLAKEGTLCCGTIDSWLVYQMTAKKQFRTDYSNAARTQLFDLKNLCWNQEICDLFQIPMDCLALPTDSDGFFGETDLEGLLPRPVSIHGVVGDSNGALFGQGCVKKGMMKATYGTGSSIMMNVGEKPVFSEEGLATSIAWKINGTLQYVLEGNVNYAGAVITWLKDQIGLVANAAESEALTSRANQNDRTYLVPAFSGLGAPYWRSDVSAAFVGMSRATTKAELVKAGLESIAYQVMDIVTLMAKATSSEKLELRADGGPTKNQYLMQFQSDILGCSVKISNIEELSGTGAAYAAGIGAGLYNCDIVKRAHYINFTQQMDENLRRAKYSGWKEAVKCVL